MAYGKKKSEPFDAGKRGKTYAACACCGGTKSPGHTCPPGMSKSKRGSKRG